MKRIIASVLGAAVASATVVPAALAQNQYADDLACRQYADAQTAPMRQQADVNTFGSALVGAGLGAALGGAIGGGRGAGIGAASGAIVGTGAGAANAQNSAAYIQQQYNSIYYSCMQSRSGYAAPAPAYQAQQPGYGYQQPYYQGQQPYYPSGSYR